MLEESPDDAPGFPDDERLAEAARQAREVPGLWRLFSAAQRREILAFEERRRAQIGELNREATRLGEGEMRRPWQRREGEG